MALQKQQLHDRSIASVCGMLSIIIVGTVKARRYYYEESVLLYVPCSIYDSYVSINYSNKLYYLKDQSNIFI